MKRKNAISAVLAVTMLAAAILPGCGADKDSGKTEIEILQYKPEAATYFDKVEEEFNATHDDIHLTISSPNDASTIMRTRFVREDYPDIIGIGGDINYSYYVDADILADVSDYPGLSDIKQSYVDILEALEITPKDGTYGVPYVANAAGILYNKDMFEEHGWQIPESWGELIDLCQEIQSEGILPFYFGFRDTWTCLAPWNSLAVDLAPADTCKQVNAGETTFTDEYRETAEKCLELVSYGPDDPFAYGYNEAYEVLDFLLEDENIQAYIDDQNAVPCKEGDFDLAPMLDGMKPYIESGNMTDYQDHYYPSEMAVDAQIQTFLINKDVDVFLAKFDKDWQRYNRDIIREVQEYNEEHGTDE